MICVVRDFYIIDRRKSQVVHLNAMRKNIQTLVAYLVQQPHIIYTRYAVISVLWPYTQGLLDSHDTVVQ